MTTQNCLLLEMTKPEQPSNTITNQSGKKYDEGKVSQSEGKSDIDVDDNSKERKVRDKIDQALAESMKKREKTCSLETGFVPFANEGMKITKPA